MSEDQFHMKWRSSALQERSVASDLRNPERCGRGESRRGHHDSEGKLATPTIPGNRPGCLHGVHSPSTGTQRDKVRGQGLVLLLSVFNIIQKKRLKTNLPYFVLGPVFPGYSQMWAATLQRPWQLTSRAKEAAVSLVSDEMPRSQHLVPESKR